MADKLESPLEQLIHGSFWAMMKTVHTMLPGVIESFDVGTQTAKVNIAQTQKLVSGEALEFPPLVNVPVQFFRWGGYSITAKPKPDDPCAVYFCERSMDRYLELGKTGQIPNDKRFFDLSDGFAVTGLIPKTKALSGFNEDGLEIRSDDGNTSFLLKDNGEVIIDNGSLTFKIQNGKIQILNGTGELITLISDILQQLSVESVIIPSGSSAGTYNLTGAALYTGFKVIADSFKI